MKVTENDLEVMTLVVDMFDTYEEGNEDPNFTKLVARVRRLAVRMKKALKEQP